MSKGHPPPALSNIGGSCMSSFNEHTVKTSFRKVVDFPRLDKKMLTILILTQCVFLLLGSNPASTDHFLL